MSTLFNGISGTTEDGSVHMQIEPATPSGTSAYFSALDVMRNIVGASAIKFHTDHETQSKAYHDAMLASREHAAICASNARESEFFANNPRVPAVD